MVGGRHPRPGHGRAPHERGSFLRCAPQVREPHRPLALPPAGPPRDAGRRARGRPPRRFLRGRRAAPAARCGLRFRADRGRARDPARAIERPRAARGGHGGAPRLPGAIRGAARGGRAGRDRARRRLRGRVCPGPGVSGAHERGRPRAARIRGRAGMDRRLRAGLQAQPCDGSCCAGPDRVHGPSLPRRRPPGRAQCAARDRGDAAGRLGQRHQQAGALPCPRRGPAGDRLPPRGGVGRARTPLRVLQQQRAVGGADQHQRKPPGVDDGDPRPGPGRDDERQRDLHDPQHVPARRGEHAPDQRLRRLPHAAQDHRLQAGLERPARDLRRHLAGELARHAHGGDAVRQRRPDRDRPA